VQNVDGRGGLGLVGLLVEFGEEGGEGGGLFEGRTRGIFQVFGDALLCGRADSRRRGLPLASGLLLGYGQQREAAHDGDGDKASQHMGLTCHGARLCLRLAQLVPIESGGNFADEDFGDDFPPAGYG
jgi:hypothetical protein